MAAPLLKWPGGKRRELDTILAALPDRPTRLHEPFVGGGAVWLATPPAVPATVNDASRDLVAFYRGVAHRDPGLLDPLDALAAAWEALRGLAHGEALAAVADAAAWPTGPRSPNPATDGVERLTTEAVRAVLGTAACREVRVLLPATDVLRDTVTTSVDAKVRRCVRLQQRREQPLDHHDRVANVLGALHAGLYTAMRTRFNALRRADAWPPERPALFWAMRELAYAAMFRRNAAGDFNVPFGGVTYSRKDLGAKVAHMRSRPVRARLATTRFLDGDAVDALEDVAAGDAVFLDPPYDTDFSAYDGRAFSWEDQVRLEAAARALPCAVVAVLKDTPRIRELWSPTRWSVRHAQHHYAWTIKQRNDRTVRHLLITEKGSRIYPA